MVVVVSHTPFTITSPQYKSYTASHTYLPLNTGLINAIQYSAGGGDRGGVVSRRPPTLVPAGVQLCELLLFLV